MDALLSGQAGPEDAPAVLRPVAEVLAALQAPPDSKEHAGWDLALTMFRQAPDPAEATVSSRSQRRPLFGARLAAAVAALALVLFGGGVAAAYTGNLPTPLQRLAHSTINAPSPRSSRPEVTPKAGQPNPSATASHHGQGNGHAYGHYTQPAAPSQKNPGHDGKSDNGPGNGNGPGTGNGNGNGNTGNGNGTGNGNPGNGNGNGTGNGNGEGSGNGKK